MNTQRSYPYRVVDVFTRTPLEGNPLAVFTQPAGLDDSTMQRIAKELSLPETVFLFPPTRPDCAAALRIFTPAKEVPFAGHPTIGTCFVLLSEGIVPAGTEHFTLEEKIGLVPIRVENAPDGLLIWLTTPPISFETTFDPAACARALGLEPADLLPIPPQIVSAGNPTLLVALKDRETVDRASLDSAGMRELKAAAGQTFCFFVFTPTSNGAYSRMFAPDYGIVEDGATGSSTGPLANFMLRHNLLPPSANRRFISEQGVKMGRRSLLHFEIIGSPGSEQFAVGGYTTPLAEAVMKL